MDFIYQVEPYITENEVEAVTDYLRSGGWLTEYKRTEQFENMIAEYLGVKHVVVLTNGTVGLYLALLALGINSTDSVIVPDYTMIASPNAVMWTGAEVALSDIEPDTLCLDLNKVVLKENTRALMYVPMNGRSGNMDEVVKFCTEHDIFLIEDACQAFASKWNDTYLGTFGDVGVFSFSPHKIITTGQGGAIVTNSDDIYEKVKKLKDFYRIKPGVDIHTGIGYNFKFTDLQSVIGIEQLKIIDYRVQRKKETYKTYMKALANVDYIKFLPIDLEEQVPWFVDVVLDTSREELISYLKAHGIGSRPFYPPIHTQDPYQQCEGDFQVTSDIAPRGLWLPSSIGLKPEEIDHILRATQKYA